MRLSSWRMSFGRRATLPWRLWPKLEFAAGISWSAGGSGSKSASGSGWFSGVVAVATWAGDGGSEQVCLLGQGDSDGGRVSSDGRPPTDKDCEVGGPPVPSGG